jgi:PTH1 family peptidyl-tRNA hydrolase
MAKLIVGLGNPGNSYEKTRHNIGFTMLDALAHEQELVWQTKPKFKASVIEYTENGEKILLARPQTFYNLVGESVRILKDFYKLENTDILVIHDELDLPFGILRTRSEGSDAGNNGIKSLSQHIGADFSRIRIGIANEHRSTRPAEVFVLEKFTQTELSAIPTLATHVHTFIEDFIHEDRSFSHTSVNATI